MDRAGGIADGPPGAGIGEDTGLRVTVGTAGVEQAYVPAPWKLFGPLYAAGRPPACYLTNTTAGILAGDHLTAEFRLLPGARLQLIAPAATRVYTMGPGRSASQRLSFTVAEGAALSYWPNQLIPYAGANFTQETTFRLAPDASLVAADLVAPGRLAFGEAFAFTAVRIHTRIHVGQRLVLAEQALLHPGQALPGRLGMFEGYTHLGSLYLAGTVAAGADLDALASLLEQRPQVLAGVSRPHPQVAVARVLGHRAEAVAAVLGALAAASANSPTVLRLPTSRV